MPSPAGGGPKADDDRAPREAGAGDGLAARYEELRHVASSNATGGGHGLALFTAKGMVHWMSAWRQLDIAPEPYAARSVGGPPTDAVVAVLASMAVACL